VQNSTYIPTYGGANKANRLILERLATRQHNCRVVAAAWGLQGDGGQAQFRRELAQRGINVTLLGPQAVVFGHHGVEVHAVEDVYQFRAYAANQIKTFAPTWTLVSSEDPGQVLLEAALEASPSRVIYLARTLQLLPFGPASFFPSPTRTRLLQRAAAVIAISDTARQYIRQWSGIEAVVLRPPTYGSGPFPYLGCFERGFVTMLNPCAVKGIAILIALARSLPDVQFAAVPTWGTTRADRAALEQLANVQLLPPADDIDAILAQTRVLLQPSLWLETWGRISMEAMLRGIPTLSSNIGGIREAKMGVDYLLPVRPIKSYTERFDERMMPVPIVPEQDIGPWREALQKLLSDRERYEQLSRASRDTALAYVSSLSIAPFEAFLANLTPAATTSQPGAPVHEGPSSKAKNQIEALSPKKRALLAQRLAQKAQPGVSQEH